MIYRYYVLYIRQSYLLYQSVPYISLKVPESLTPTAIVLPTPACCAAVDWTGAGSRALPRNQTTPWAEEFQGLVAEGKFIIGIWVSLEFEHLSFQLLCKVLH